MPVGCASTHRYLTNNGDTAAIDYNASAAAVESAIDAVVGYSVTGSAGGPWTCESDAQEAYSWSGAEDPSNPLRKGLGIEVVTDQEGDNDWEGSGGEAFSVSALAGAGTVSVCFYAGRRRELTLPRRAYLNLQYRHW